MQQDIYAPNDLIFDFFDNHPLSKPNAMTHTDNNLFTNEYIFNQDFSPANFDDIPVSRYHSVAIDNNISSSHRASLPNIYLSQPQPQLKAPTTKRRQSIATSQDVSAWNRMIHNHDKPLNYPVITKSDVDAVNVDSTAIPRQQKKKFEGDQYTPTWVRYAGQLKEGYCDTCGKWLQLKNSAYWYHKQFLHGISSVSGKPFESPLQRRPSEQNQDLTEGLCHQCHRFVPVSNLKRRNSVLWYRHAHKCHIYDKPLRSSISILKKKY